MPNQQMTLCFVCLKNDSQRDIACNNVNATILSPDWLTNSINMVQILDGSMWCGNYTSSSVEGKYYVYFNATNSDGLNGAGISTFEVFTNYTPIIINSSLFLNSTISQSTQEEENKMIIASIILLPMILGLFFIIGAATLSTERHAVIKIFLFLLSLLSFFVSCYVGMISIIKYFDFPELQTAVGNMIFWFGLAFLMIMCYFLAYGVISMTHFINQKKKEEMEY